MLNYDIFHQFSIQKFTLVSPFNDFGVRQIIAKSHALLTAQHQQELQHNYEQHENPSEQRYLVQKEREGKSDVSHHRIPKSPGIPGLRRDHPQSNYLLPQAPSIKKTIADKKVDEAGKI